MLHFAGMESGDRASVRSIDLETQQFVAINPDAPRGVHLGNYSAVQFKNRVGSIVCRCGIAGAIFIRPPGNMGAAQGAYRAHRSEKIVEDIAPVTKHVDNDTASIFFPIIPGGALRRLPVSLKNPITKLSANRKDPAEKAIFNKGLFAPVVFWVKMRLDVRQWLS